MHSHSGRGDAGQEPSRAGVPRAARARPRGPGPAWLRVSLVLVLLLLAFDAAALRKVAAGKAPALDADEGLLVVSVDSSSEIGSVRFGRSGGGLFSSGLLSRIEAGHTVQMYAVPAGRYQWTRVTLLDTWLWRTSIDLSDDPEYQFEVKPGQITYAGDLIVRPSGLASASLHIANRSLHVIDWLEQNHPALYAAHAFGYSGYYPDPFPGFYRDARATLASAPADPDAGHAPPAAGNLDLPASVAWSWQRVEAVALSPDGSLVAEIVRNGEDAWTLDLVDVDAGTRQPMVRSGVEITGIEWEGDDILLATTADIGGARLRAFVIGDRAAGGRTIEQFEGPRGGSVVDLLPAERRTILYESHDDRGQLVVHRLGIHSRKAFAAFDGMPGSERLNRGVTDDRGWYADGSGVLRAAIAGRDDGLVLMHGRGASFREVLRLSSDSAFVPLRLSFDGELLYGLSDEGRAQRDLVVFDPAQGRVTQTLYSRPGIDVVHALFDDRRTPIGVSYYEGGRLVSDYFGAVDREVDALVRGAFPGRSAAIGDRSADGRRMLLWVDASDAPPQLYYLDVAARRAELLDDVLPALAGRRFVPTQVLQVARADGPPLEAFLTLPPGEGRRPLVVMPHGGPWGVADRLHFNQEVQYIAGLGYAVLQVNFRGSDGYGRAFREAARGQYGTGIEEDIGSALQHALANHPLDPDRMCVVGASYGGYSALVSSIRWPGRFRCAVSISGVSDRVLFFTASDGGRSAHGRKELEQWLGDPRADLDAMLATSPLYQYEKLEVPLMLVHGREDLRVDYEHARRLVRLLNFAGRTPTVLTLDDEGHSFSDNDSFDAAWTGIAGFLRAHLGPGAAATASAHAQ